MGGNEEKGLLKRLEREERKSASGLYGIRRLEEDLGLPIEELERTGWSAEVVAVTREESPRTVRFSRGETTIVAGEDVLKVERPITSEVKLSVIDDRGSTYGVLVDKRPQHSEPGRTITAVFEDSGSIRRDECSVFHDIRGNNPLGEEDVVLLRTSLERLDLGETTENGIGFKGLSREGVENNATKGPDALSLLKKLILGESR